MNHDHRHRPTAVAALLTLLVALGGMPTAAATGADPALPGFRTTPARDVVDVDLLDLLAEVGSMGAADAFVHFDEEVAYADGVAAVEDAGLTVSLDLPAAHAVYAFGLAGEIVVLSRAPEVVFLEEAGTEPLHLGTAAWATRARTLYEPTGGLDLTVSDHDGEPLDGREVGIAIVDSGIDATHPDLRWAGFGEADPTTIKNFKVVCAVFDLSDAGCAGPVVLQDVPDSDTTSGHGTHVGGIAAGTGRGSDSDGDPGTESDRMFRGVAPGAKLYGFGAGEGLSIVVPFAAASFQWIYDHGLAQDPPIRVVNNSWGGAGAHNANLAISKLSNALIQDRNITVVFAAGNSNGDGSSIQTNSYANNPTPGVLSVANYNDGGTGTRDGALSGSSSRGLASNRATWPDVSAPGTLITAACKIATVVCPTGTPIEYPPHYTTVSGTSMAAPHVAGVVALLYQANPRITPAQVEEVLTDTAHKFTAGAPYVPDPSDPTRTSSFDKGHGLADARVATLRTLGLPDDYGLEDGGAPTVSVAAPADGAEVPPTFTVAGGAGTGAGTGAPEKARTVIADDDGGDVPIDSVDLERVTLEENLDDGTVTIGWEVRGTSTLPVLGQPFGYRFTNSIDGVSRLLQVNWDGTTTVCAQALTATCTASKVGNTFTATYPAEALGATRGAIMFDAFASTFTGVIQDRAPGDVGATILTHPARGEEHVFLGREAVGPGPTGEVFLSVDGGPARSVGTGEGSFTWETTVGPLGPGAHTLTAELRLDGAPTTPPTTDSVTVTVREEGVEAEIVITAPDDGDEVPATLIEVAGSSGADPDAGEASVVVRATAPGFDSGDIAARDTSADRFATWVADVDLSGQEDADVLITAALRLDGEAAATDRVTVTVVPVPPAGAACDPQGIGFWRQQAEQGQAARFTGDEYERLAFRAAERSEGYFPSGDQVTSAVRARGGGLDPLARAERQLAALLLNLAAFDLSGSMTFRTGLDPATALDPDTYDSATVGSTAGEAASWARGQLPGGDVGGANEVAGAINNRQGLLCDEPMG